MAAHWSDVRTSGTLRLMLIRVADQALIEDLCVHFRRSGYTAGSVGGGMVEVSQPNARTPAQERTEIELHARVWEAMHPEAEVEIL